MKVVSIVYGRADLATLQRGACAATLPPHTFLVAAHADAPARAYLGIDIDLQYEQYAGCPGAYVEAVDQVQRLFPQEDLLVLESDIIPLAGVAGLLQHSFIREYCGQTYPGVRFFKRDDSNPPVQLLWQFIRDLPDDPLSVICEWEEYIGTNAFVHFNAGDKGVADSDNRRAVFDHFCRIYGVQTVLLRWHEYSRLFPTSEPLPVRAPCIGGVISAVVSDTGDATMDGSYTLLWSGIRWQGSKAGTGWRLLLVSTADQWDLQLWGEDIVRRTLPARLWCNIGTTHPTGGGVFAAVGVGNWTLC